MLCGWLQTDAQRRGSVAAGRRCGARGVGGWSLARAPAPSATGMRRRGQSADSGAVLARADARASPRWWGRGTGAACARAGRRSHPSKARTGAGDGARGQSRSTSATRSDRGLPPCRGGVRGSGVDPGLHAAAAGAPRRRSCAATTPSVGAPDGASSGPAAQGPARMALPSPTAAGAGARDAHTIMGGFPSRGIHSVGSKMSSSGRLGRLRVHIGSRGPGSACGLADG